MAVLTLQRSGVRAWFCGHCLFAMGPATGESALLRRVFLHLAGEHGLTVRARSADQEGEYREATEWVLR